MRLIDHEIIACCSSILLYSSFIAVTADTLSKVVIRLRRSRLGRDCVGPKCHHLVQNGTY